MLTHIVVWKYRADVSDEKRREHLLRLRALPLHIPEIKSFDVGFDTLYLERSYDTGLVADFRDRPALDAYTLHPLHQEVAEMGRKISEHIVSVDFESSAREQAVSEKID